MAATKGTIVVTGANGALGSAIVGRILKRPELANDYAALYTVRKAASATQLKSALSSAPSSHRHQTLDMDLSSLASVRKAAAEINSQVSAGKIPPIRALILNAGYQDHYELNMSDDGYEMTWQVNYLSNLVLALLLLESMDKEHGRILVVGSWSHDVDDSRNLMGGKPYEDPKWHSLFPGPEMLAKGKWSTPDDDATHFAGYRRYGASKLCAVMLQQELDKRLAQDPKLSNVTVVGLDPGGMGSDLGRRGNLTFRVQMKILLPIAGWINQYLSPNGAIRTPWKSAGDIVWACFDIDVASNEHLYFNGTDKIEVAKDAQDLEKRRALWKHGVEAGGIKQGDTLLEEWQ